MKTYKIVINEADDMRMTVIKGKKFIISNGFKSSNYNSDNIIAVTALNGLEATGRNLNPIVKALMAAGAEAYVNKKQAGMPTIFIEKTQYNADYRKEVIPQELATKISKILDVNINDWIK